MGALQNALRRRLLHPTVPTVLQRAQLREQDFEALWPSTCSVFLTARPCSPGCPPAGWQRGIRGHHGRPGPRIWQASLACRQGDGAPSQAALCRLPSLQWPVTPSRPRSACLPLPTSRFGPVYALELRRAAQADSTDQVGPSGACTAEGLYSCCCVLCARMHLAGRRRGVPASASGYTRRLRLRLWTMALIHARRPVRLGPSAAPLQFGWVNFRRLEDAEAAVAALELQPVPQLSRRLKVRYRPV